MLYRVPGSHSSSSQELAKPHINGTEVFCAHLTNAWIWEVTGCSKTQKICIPYLQLPITILRLLLPLCAFGSVLWYETSSVSSEGAGWVHGWPNARPYWAMCDKVKPDKLSRSHPSLLASNSQPTFCDVTAHVQQRSHTWLGHVVSSPTIMSTGPTWWVPQGGPHQVLAWVHMMGPMNGGPIAVSLLKKLLRCFLASFGSQCDPEVSSKKVCCRSLCYKFPIKIHRKVFIRICCKFWNRIFEKGTLWSLQDRLW